MRISLLIDREPFGSVLERTLSDYWSRKYGTAYQVAWNRPLAARGEATQNWYGNAYLNCIFRPAIDSAAFEPVRREFARSTVRWRRPWQRAYVRLASGRPTSAWLAQHQMRVSPPVPAADQLLIVPGNRKIRLLNHTDQLSVCMLKHGFAADGFHRELVARAIASEVACPVPELLEVCRDAGCYTEHYITGTPLNRLSSAGQQREATRSAVAHLKPFVVQTQQVRDVATYATELLHCIQRSLVPDNRHNHPKLTLAEQQARRLHSQVCEGWQGELLMSMTHGDFQPANVLRRRERRVVD